MRSTCLLAVLALLAAAAASPATQARPSPARACGRSLASALASTRSATQIVTVLGARPSSTTGTMRLWAKTGGCWSAAAGPWTVYLGYGGISDDHHEGDGTTPSGAFGIGPVLYGVAPNPGVHYPYHRLVCGDWWDEDPSSPEYNTFQHLRCGTSPAFGGSSEPLWQSTRAYARLAFVEYNSHPAVPGRGSAIFIHADLGHPTNGCVSLPPSELVRLLRWLQPGDHPLVVTGTAAEIRRF